MIKEIIQKSEKKSFLIAYSGGLDSTVLLYKFLKEKKKTKNIKIRAIHINHHLNDASIKWEQHCKKNCYIHNVPLITEHIYIHKNKGNIESILRKKRYHIFFQYLSPDETLLTGHHLNDQCETFFLFLKRGSGPTGLSGIHFRKVFNNKTVIRPFLNSTKKELESWAYKNNLKWIEDFSNLNTNYDRNFIRHKIIPKLEQKWPFFLKNCTRTIKICQEETKLMNYFLCKKIKNFLTCNGALNILKFQYMPKEMCTALIRYWLFSKNNLVPSYNNVQCIYDQMIFSKKDANPKIIVQNYEVRRYKKLIFLIKEQKSIKNTIFFWKNQRIPLVLPNNLGYLIQNKKGNVLPAPKKNQLINIRFQHEGNILILGRNKRRKIKKIWQEKNIPPWLRHEIPLLFYDDNLISAIGVFVVDLKNEINNFWTISWQNDLKL